MRLTSPGSSVGDKVGVFANHDVTRPVFSSLLRSVRAPWIGSLVGSVGSLRGPRDNQCRQIVWPLDSVYWAHSRIDRDVSSALIFCGQDARRRRMHTVIGHGARRKGPRTEYKDPEYPPRSVYETLYITSR